MRRLATAAVGIPLVLLGIRYAPPPVFAAVIAALAVLGFLELARMAAARGIAADRWVGIPFSAALPFSWLLPDTTTLLLAAATLAVVGHLVFSGRALEQALPTAGATLVGVLWVGLLLSYFVATRIQPRGDRVLLALLLVVWLGDSGAYYVGRAFGRRKLAPHLSPGKTIAGLMGSLLASVLAVLLARTLLELPRRPSLLEAIALGLLVAAAATIGDLAESALKRGAGVKDSGSLFPGHGGVLDRLDSLLFAAPVMYYYFYWLPGPDRMALLRLTLLLDPLE